MTKPIQLSLAIRLPDDATFNNYYPGVNAAALDYVERLCDFDAGWMESLLYLWGQQGVGCSHLLQAACLQFELTGRSAIYLPLAELVHYTPEIVENLEQYDLVCLDDLQCIAGKKQWEEALFHLFNRLRDSGKQLLLAADAPPRGLSIQLADLQSRLSLALVFQLHILSDEDKLNALQLRASKRGVQLSDDVATFILSRGSRDMAALFELLDKLDKASLQAKHKLTIPFVKQVLNW